jgi:flagellar biosynthesis protein FlhG
MTHTSKRSPKIICVSSGKGGVGKTSFSVNVAAALAQKGKKVLLIDGDLGLANVDVLLGLNIRHTIREALEDARDPLSLLVEIIPGFHILPASSGVPEMANLTPEAQAFLTRALDGIVARFDFVLVDTAAGIGDSVLWFNHWAEENIVILSPDPTAMTDAYALIKVLNTRHGKKHFSLIVNSVKSKKEADDVFLNMSNVLARFLHLHPDHLGSIPQDSSVGKAIRQQKPFLLLGPEGKASRSVYLIADTIIKM